MPIQSTDTVTSTNTQNEKKTQQNGSTNSSFSDVLNQSKEEQLRIEEQENVKKLVEDLISMVKTGLTVSELEMLQELLAKLNTLKAKSDSDPKAEKELKAILSTLEAAVLAIKKRLSGEAIINQDEKNTLENDNSTKSRIEAVTEAVKDIISHSTSEDKLLEDLMNKSNPNLLKHLSTNNFKLDKSEYITDEEFDEIADKLNLKNISEDDMKLFKSIIEDQYITNDEVKGLSYEQMETLGKFVFVEEGVDGYVDKTTMNTDFKAGTLLSIPIISNDKNFNKAIFKIVEKMDGKEENKYEIQQFMWPITGTPHSSSLIAFPELQATNYNGKDMGKVLDDLLSDFKTSLDNSTRANVKQYYQTKISQFTDLLNLYNEFSGNDEEQIKKEKYITNIKLDLVADMLSMIKTGFTVSEMESLEKMIIEINKLIEDSKDEKVSEEKVKDMISKLEAEISKLQDRLNTKITNEEDEIEENDDTKKLTNIMKEFKSIVNSLEDTLSQIKEESTKLIKTVNTDDELRLRESLKNKY